MKVDRELLLPTIWSWDRQKDHRTMHKVEPHLWISVNKSELVNVCAATYLTYAAYLKL